MFEWSALDLNIKGNRPRRRQKHNSQAFSQTTAALNEQLFTDHKVNSRESIKRKNENTVPRELRGRINYS